MGYALLALAYLAVQPLLAAEPKLAGVFVGSTPGDELVAKLVQLPGGTEPPLQWELHLFRDAATQAPLNYHLRCRFAATPGQFEQRGAWKMTKGTKSDAGANVYELDGALALTVVSENLLHLLSPDRSLMIGNGGWSYTLNRTNAAEPPQPAPPANAPSVSYRIDPVATGPGVFGVFEGRTPCLGIARELHVPLDEHRMKAKWRVTLLQDPDTKAPTTYKLEGSLFRQSKREGTWSILRGTAKNPAATVYRLAPANGQEALLLLQGDDNILFFLDQTQNLLIGHSEFSYTLNRRLPGTQAAASPTTSARSR